MSDAGLQPLLIELGCEELPPLALDRLARAFFTGVCDRLAEEGIDFDRERSLCLSSPRRMSMILESVAAQQADRVLERKGPSVAAAFDDQGVPTRAATGFAQSVGVEVDQLERLETDKGAWLFCRVEQAGKPLRELLYPILQSALEDLPVPRPMRWSDHDFSFVRPVHWLVVLHGDQVLPGTLYGCDADRITRGHRVMAPGLHAIPHAHNYVELLKERFVLVDPAGRKDQIRSQAMALGNTAGGSTRLTEALLGEVNNLLEWPVAVKCAFDPGFLEVPAEALIASMEYHQKFFPILDADGALTPEFVVMANIESTDEDAMRSGFERVIAPRLADAQFFWQQDLKQPIESWLESLDRVVFQKKMGTIGDKTRRIANISRILAEDIDGSAWLAERAGRYSKADLVSQMVGEFPELQGTMGAHYLRHSGEDEIVADAVEGHYRPRFSGDDLPDSETARIVALADRLDTIVGVFAAGLKPTGNRDPFALRRAALGIIRLLEEGGLAFDLDYLLSISKSELEGQLEVTEETLGDVRSFVLERLRNHLLDGGATTGQVNAVLAAPLAGLPDLRERVNAVQDFMQQAEADSLVAANKRIANILKKQEETVSEEIDVKLMQLDEEKALFAVVNDIKSAVTPLFNSGNYADALAKLASLREPVDAYFDSVMVMDEDLAVRRNRLAQLAAVKQLFDQVADFSQAD